VAVWRAPLWQRILFPAVGLAMVAGAFWPYAGGPYEPIWVGVAVGAVLVIWALRPKLTLFEDAVYIRGRILSRLIPIEQIAAVEGAMAGSTSGWATGTSTRPAASASRPTSTGCPGAMDIGTP
jgi:hypothetical protein